MNPSVREALDRVEKEILLHGEDDQFTQDLRTIINFANRAVLGPIAQFPDSILYPDMKGPSHD